MSKRKKVASVMFTGTAAAAMVGVGVQPAAAAPSDWTITPGGATTGENTTPAVLTVDTDLGAVSLVCPPTTVDATANLVTSANGIPAELGDINTTTFGTPTSPCSFLGFGVVAELDSPINLNAIDEQTVAGGVTTTPGNLTGNPNINATITGVGGFNCDMHVTGTTPLPGSYVETQATGTLKVNPNRDRTLHIDTVNGCQIFGLDLIHESDMAGFQADFDVDPVQRVTHES